MSEVKSASTSASRPAAHRLPAAAWGVAGDCSGYGTWADCVSTPQDARVRLLEKTNARYLTRGQLGEVVDLIVMDVAFISATLVLPATLAAAFSGDPSERIGRRIIVLVKPQFEVGREQVGKRGIVRDETLQMAAVEKVRRALEHLGCVHTDVIESPILGAEGNREFLLAGVY